MHPLFHLLATRPQLLADHAEAYAELVAVEINRMSATWTRLALLNAMALCSLSVALALAGVALMLWAVTAGIAGAGAMGPDRRASAALGRGGRLSASPCSAAASARPSTIFASRSKPTS